MKKLFCVLAISTALASCGNSPSSTNGSDSSGTTVSADTTHKDSSNMMSDTTHKDSVVH